MIGIDKPNKAKSYKRIRFFTSDENNLLTDGAIRNLRLEKIGESKPYHMVHTSLTRVIHFFRFYRTN